ncbi:CGMP-dependent protein kinase [Aphelenchoides bicaudatus]|nr:CGMP-dependent protein kinase [Aphelenchoides bicaudatus]
MLSREELLIELERRDQEIRDLTAELAKYRSYFHGRKIAISSEAPNSSNATKQIPFVKDPAEQRQIDAMIKAMQPVKVEQNNWIIREGDNGNQLFVLSDGKVQVTKDSRFIRVMDAPSVFGELALLYNCTRTASVKAINDCQLWSLERQIFHSIMINTAKSKSQQIMEQMKNSRRLTQLFNEDQLNFLAETANEEHFDFRTEIDGSQVEGKIYLIVTERRPSSYGASVELKNLGVGDLFGDFYGLSVIASGSSNLASNTFFRAAASSQKPTSRQVPTNCTLNSCHIFQL